MKKLFLILILTIVLMSVSCTIFGEYEDYDGETHSGVCGSGNELAIFSVVALYLSYKTAKAMNRKTAKNELR